jgi:chromosome segregation ATPase
MPSDVTRDEFDQLASRTDVLEREVEGEKMVTRHVLEHNRRNTEDLSALRTKVEGLDRKFDGLRGQFDGLRTEFGGLRGEFVGLRGEFRKLRDDLPGIVGKALREAIKPLMRK